MKYLITGGLGFIGVNLVRKLLQDESSQIYILDSKPTGISHKQITFFNKSTSDDLLFLSNHTFDAVFLLGSKSGREIREMEVRDNKKILEVLSNDKLRIVFPSSQLIYEDPENTGFETDSEYRLNDLYTKSKVLMEKELISNSLNNQNHTFTVFRISNPYGIHFPRIQSYNIANQLLYTLIKNEVIKIYGDGSYKKNFIPIENVATIFIDTVKNNKFTNEIINLGMSEDIALKEFYTKAQTMFSSGTIEFDLGKNFTDSKIKTDRLFNEYDKNDLITHEEQLSMMKDFYSEYKIDSTFDEFLRKIWEIK